MAVASTTTWMFEIATPPKRTSSRDWISGKELGIGAEDELAAVLEQERDADRGDERR